MLWIRCLRDFSLWVFPGEGWCLFFEVEFVSFPHQSYDSAVDPELFVFIFLLFYVG